METTIVRRSAQNSASLHFRFTSLQRSLPDNPHIYTTYLLDYLSSHIPLHLLLCTMSSPSPSRNYRYRNSYEPTNNIRGLTVHLAHMQRRRTQRDIIRDSEALQAIARSRSDLLQLLWMRRSRLATVHEPVQVTTQLAEIAYRRSTQRQGTSRSAVPILDFEIPAQMNPPPKPGPGERKISV